MFLIIVFFVFKFEIYSITLIEIKYFIVCDKKDEKVLTVNLVYSLYLLHISCSQNVDGDYPIMVQVFICKAGGKELDESDESRNIRWVSLKDLRDMLRDNEESFYPMHVSTLKKYLNSKKL